MAPGGGSPVPQVGRPHPWARFFRAGSEPCELTAEWPSRSRSESRSDRSAPLGWWRRRLKRDWEEIRFGQISLYVVTKDLAESKRVVFRFFHIFFHVAPLGNCSVN